MAAAAMVRKGEVGLTTLKLLPVKRFSFYIERPNLLEKNCASAMVYVHYGSRLSGGASW